NPTSEAFINACLELGYPRTEDFNGPQMIGAGWHHVNIKDGKRHSTAVAYLNPAFGRPNLTLYTNAQATRLLCEGKRCVGVEYHQDGELKTARCNYEVIVCAGPIESPKLLLLSGVGNAAHLKEFNIPVVADLPGVGENFHNHILTGVICEALQPIPPPHLNLSESALFCKSDPGWIGPDLQIVFVHVPFDIIIGQGHPHSVSILPGVVRPVSRGWIRLASPYPLDKPLINPNYLGCEADLSRLVQGMKIAREIFATKAFSGWAGRELMPGPDVRYNDQRRASVRQNAYSYHQRGGACKRVLDGLFGFVRQWVFNGVGGFGTPGGTLCPAVPSGNCHAGIVMTGEKASDLIKDAHRLHPD